MGILTTFLVLLSCALVGAGVWLVLRDTRWAQARDRHKEAAPGEDRASVSAIEAGPQSRLTGLSSAQHAPASPPRGADTFETDLSAALRAVNGAFAPAGICLVPSVEPLAPGKGAPELAVMLMAGDRCVGSLQVVRLGEVVEIAAASQAGGPAGVERSRRLQRDDASIPSLAEAIAACAWPVVTWVPSPRSGKS